ncbi:hypothetical protein PIB30_091477 [Stylosanthes scabra]|uniref:Uncharacterized protein n=1 Tax=Stylosanthes scabra TaxID=79078 RepID=A0ABU6ZTV1_9FABA|nr:hypothetical protein [Stylosanthes scabra]
MPNGVYHNSQSTTLLEPSGELMHPLNLEELREAVMKDCHTIAEMKMMGSWKAVMTFNSIANMVEAENSSCILNQFAEIRRWTPREVNRSRRRWLEIYGLPANAWTKQI